ncbi:MAG: type II toxin-antitoxin system VapC family toxin [Candidatus Methylomirabilales bacterium]
MLVYYFDTSALVKRYHVEPGSGVVDQLFAEPEAAFLIANITIAELTSALVRKLHAGVITRPVLDHVLSAVAHDLLTDFWIIDLERVHVLQSRELILKHHLRTLDGLQLAVLLALRDLPPILVCSDQKLIESGVGSGLLFAIS